VQSDSKSVADVRHINPRHLKRGGLSLCLRLLQAQSFVVNGAFGAMNQLNFTGLLRRGVAKSA